MIEYTVFTVNFVSENTYLAFDTDTRDAVIIDCGAYSSEERKDIKAFVADKGLTLKHHFLTHAHFDHVMGAGFIFETYGARPELCVDEVETYNNAEHQMELFIHRRLPLNLPPLGPTFKDGDTVGEGALQFKVIATPGHTPGGVCLLGQWPDAPLFTGDSLFRSSIGRCDLIGGNERSLIESLRAKVLTLSESTICLPGHGPETNVREEKCCNMYLA